MKQIIKSILIPLIFSTICGFITARLVFNIYQDDLSARFSSSKIYLIQNGEYDSYEEMRKSNLGTSYVYYEDNEKYKSVVGITQKADNISKIKKIYSDELIVEEYYVGPDVLNNKQTDYDKQLASIEDPKEVQELVNEIINLYKVDDTIRLILAK